MDTANETFADRLNAVLDAANFPPKGDGRQVALSKKFGVSQKGARKWLEGEGLPKMARIAEIASAFGVSTEYLLTGRDPQHYALSADAATNPLDRLPPHLRPGRSAEVVAWHDPSELPANTLWIPHYDVSASAGNGQTVSWSERSSNEPLPFRPEFFAARKLRAEHCRCLYVRGDSMEPELFDHDTIMVDTQDTAIRDGGVYAMLYADELYIKLLYRIPGGGVEMRSRNPVYPPVRIVGPDLERLIVLGRKVYRSG